MYVFFGDPYGGSFSNIYNEDTYHKRYANDHFVLKALGDIRSHPRLFMVYLYSAAVYGTVLIAIAETASESFVAYALLGSGWGNPNLPNEPSSAPNNILSNLQPLFDALRERFPSSIHGGADRSVSNSRPFCATLLYLEDIDVL
jgi:hypothetical protein